MYLSLKEVAGELRVKTTKLRLMICRAEINRTAARLHPLLAMTA
jgi:hypothetical protein